MRPLPAARPAPFTRPPQVPHGALQDSGRVAATGYALLQERAAPQQALRVLILGTNHFILQPAACLSTAEGWATPLGTLLVDRELNAELHAAGIPYDDEPHRPASAPSPLHSGSAVPQCSINTCAPSYMGLSRQRAHARRPGCPARPAEAPPAQRTTILS